MFIKSSGVTNTTIQNFTVRISSVETVRKCVSKLDIRHIVSALEKFMARFHKKCYCATFLQHLSLSYIESCMSGFHGAFATNVTCQQGTLTLPEPGFVPFSDLNVLKLLRPIFSTLPLEYLSVLSQFCLQNLL